MLRLDVDGGAPYATIITTNPFGGPGNPLDEIWSVGLRNPWRYSFDRLTGDLWIGDVGQNAWEEVNIKPASSPGGLNWGWRCMESNAQYNFSGTCSTLTFASPVHVYSRSNSYAITGGYVSRGSPGTRSASISSPTTASPTRRAPFPFNGSHWTATNHTLLPSGNVLAPNSFGQDGYGDLYIADDSTGSVQDEPAPSLHSRRVHDRCQWRWAP